MPNAFGIFVNWGRWSEMVGVKLPDIMSGSIAFENILSVRVWEGVVILVGFKIKGINELEIESLKIHLSDYAHYNS